MFDLLIKSGRIIDPASGTDSLADILIAEGKIVSLKPGQQDPRLLTRTIDAKGLIILPGLIDMHVHLRDPGQPEEETIGSGTRAAALGGFTSIACMANTSPPIDNPAMIEYIYSKTKLEGLINVFPIGAVTKGLKGQELAEIGRMLDTGAAAFSDDGHPIMNAQIMRLALEYAMQFNVPIISHAEDLGLSNQGDMNESYLSTIWGLKGAPSLAEEVMIARDLMLAKEYGNLHIAHVSSKKSVDLIRKAKAEGVKATCETCPHYFTLTEEQIENYNTNAKVNPPLRGPKDVEAIIEGLADGTIDVIASDHAPHSIDEKKVEFAKAASGMIGLETALALVLTELVETKALSMKDAIAKLTIAPAEVLRLKKGYIKAGADADLTIIDPKVEWTVDVSKFSSRSKNSPFQGWKLKGKTIYTIVRGRVVVAEGKIVL